MLDRLKRRKAKINNDTVALEAGRKKGSIKKSRPQFAALIQPIDMAGKEVIRPELDVANRFEHARSNVKDMQRRLDASLARELALVREVFRLRKDLAVLRGAHVVPFQSPAQPAGRRR